MSTKSKVYKSIEAMRIITGGNILTSIQRLYEEMEVEKLSVRRQIHQYTWQTFYLVLCRIYIDISLVLIILLRFVIFLPSALKPWNNLPIDIRNSISLNSLKAAIKKKPDKKLSYYYLGCKYGQVLHARLRMNSSYLREHLFMRGLVDSPDSASGQSEFTSNFLLSCRNYDTLHAATFSNWSFQFQMDLRIVLYGTDALTH